MSSSAWLSLLIALPLLNVACGDDGAPPTDAATDTAADAGDTARPDTGGPMCTALPEVVDTGMTAETDPGIDPGDFETPSRTIPDPAAPENAADFPHGIQSGAMKPTSANFWTHYTGSEELWLWVYREGATAGEIVIAFEEMVTPDAQGYVRHEATGLAPATIYTYAFVEGGMAATGRSPLGRVRTALADDMALKLTFGATTCTGTSQGFGDADGGRRQALADQGYPALTMLAEQELDALLHLGDMTYNDPAWAIASGMPVANTGDIYRSDDAGWGFTLGIQGYRDVLSSTGMYLTLDDHEVVDSDAFNPETIEPTRFAAALDAMVQNTAIERQEGGELWHSYQWGQTAEVIVTDVRTERRPSTIDTDAPIFISPEQMAFLKDRLMNTTAHFKLVFTSVNISNLPEQTGWDIPFAFRDRWEGYAAQREELLDFIVDNDIENVVFLAGDIHVGFVGRLEPEGTSPYDRIWEITVGPGASNANPLGELLEDGIFSMEEVLPCNQYVHASGRTQVATTLELDPLADTLRIRFVDALTDEVLFDDVLQP